MDRPLRLSHSLTTLLKRVPAMLALAALVALTVNCADDSAADDVLLPRYGWHIRANPKAALDDLPTVVQLVIEAANDAEPAPELLLLRGGFDAWNRPTADTPRMKNRLARVPTTQWLDADDRRVVAPSQALTPGGVYTLASLDGTPLAELTVGDDERLPRMELVWPPGGRHAEVAGTTHVDGNNPANAGFDGAVWCRADRQPLSRWRYPALFGPSSLHAELHRGAGQDGGWPHCVRLAPNDETAASSWLQPPPLVYDAAGYPALRLSPTPLRGGAAEQPVEQLSCEGEWRPAGPGCVRLSDGELLLQTPPQALLWLVRLDAARLHPPKTIKPLEVVAPMRGDSVVLPLPPINDLTLTVETVDLSGRRHHQELAIDQLAWQSGANGYR